MIQLRRGNGESEINRYDLYTLRGSLVRAISTSGPYVARINSNSLQSDFRKAIDSFHFKCPSTNAYEISGDGRVVACEIVGEGRSYCLILDYSILLHKIKEDPIEEINAPKKIVLPSLPKLLLEE